MNVLQLTKEQEEKLHILQSKLFMARSNYEVEQIMKEIIKLIPNDYDLGTYIRGLFNYNK